MKNWRAIILLIPVGAGGLAGCGSVEGEAAGGASTSVAAEPAAFHFESGDLALGEFDPRTIGGNLFDPCAEISDEEFAAVGLARADNAVSAKDREGLRACQLRSDSPYVVEGIVANAVTRDMVASQTELLDGFSNGVVPGLFVYLEEPMGDDTCTAAVETNRGSLSASVMEIQPDASTETRCTRATEIMEALYLLARG